MLASLKSFPEGSNIRVYASLSMAALLLDAFYKKYQIQLGGSLDKIPNNAIIKLPVDAEDARYIWTALMWLSRDPKLAKYIYIREGCSFKPRDEFKLFGGYKKTSLYNSVFKPVIGEHKVEYTPEETMCLFGHYAPTVQMRYEISDYLTDNLMDSFFSINGRYKQVEFTGSKALEELKGIGYIKLAKGISLLSREKVEKLRLNSLHAVKIFGFNGIKFLLRCTLGLKRLGLGENDLVDLGGPRLKELFGVIPASITHLSLAVCELNKLTADELACALSGIPETVELLDLSFNDLNQFTKEELTKIVKAIPATTKIDLTDNYLDKNLCCSLEQRTSATDALPQRRIASTAPNASVSSSGQNFFPQQGTSSVQSTNNQSSYGMGKPSF